MAALLHDVVADSDVTVEEFRRRNCPPEVVEAIDRLTLRAGESFDEFIMRISKDPVARRVKIADLADNLDLRNWKDIGEPERERLIRYRRGWETLVSVDREQAP